VNSATILFLTWLFFFSITVYWHNKISKKKVEIEEKERALLKEQSEIYALAQYERLISILESIDDGLDEWQSVESVHCPYELRSFKIAQEEIKELIHDLEVTE